MHHVGALGHGDDLVDEFGGVGDADGVADVELLGGCELGVGVEGWKGGRLTVIVSWERCGVEGLRDVSVGFKMPLLEPRYVGSGRFTLYSFSCFMFRRPRSPCSCHGLFPVKIQIGLDASLT